MHAWFLGNTRVCSQTAFRSGSAVLQASLYSQETDKQKHTENTLRYDDARIPYATHVMRNKKNPARMMWNNGGQRLPITLTTVVALTISRGLHCPRPICINHRVGQCGIECRYLIRYFRLHKNGSIYHQVCLLVQIIYSFSLVENFSQFNFQ